MTPPASPGGCERWLRISRGLAWQWAAACSPSGSAAATGPALSCPLMPAQCHFISGGKTKLREVGGCLQEGTARPPCPSTAMQLLACTATMPGSCMAQDWLILYARSCGARSSDLHSFHHNPMPLPCCLLAMLQEPSAVAGKSLAALEGLWQAQLDHRHMGQDSVP